jgi:hypothetical protein
MQKQAFTSTSLYRSSSIEYTKRNPPHKSQRVSKDWPNTDYHAWIKQWVIIVSAKWHFLLLYLSLGTLKYHVEKLLPHLQLAPSKI